jgi:hypothetical protein
MIGLWNLYEFEINKSLSIIYNRSTDQVAGYFTISDERSDI